MPVRSERDATAAAVPASRMHVTIACQMLGAMGMEAFAERARRELLTTRSRGASPRRLASRTASAGPPLASRLYTWRIRAWPAPDDNHRDPAANEQDTKERHTMWPAKYSVSIRTLRADALFVSALQRSDEPSVDQVQQAITAAVRAFGRAGCAERVAQEFGDHSETAVIRMRWARAVTHEAFTETAPDPDPRPDADPLLVVGPRLPAGETSDSPGRAA